MNCSHCYRSISINSIAHQRGKGLATEVQCPHCDAWIGRSPRLARFKLLGFYTTAIALGAIFLLPEYKTVAIAVAIFAAILLMVSHFMDQMKTIEAPPQVEEDVEAHRRKYR
ncbi:hypothetical protein [Shewanella gelidii]|uniref:Membrane protein n=1 Tax=Shewanella gelidii TaxID=1642821 RepID=A0A917NC59_9GAMM|nr:hypothetical protein [Shewanella gelidii]MCL1098826.1 hypothetical protein [Shewanella gelidii]GGI87398.1 membrane protein [Shewanella gelidii]